MIYADKTVLCTECGLEFVVRAADQQRQATAGFRSEPRRCPECWTTTRSAAQSRRSPAPRSRRGFGPIGMRTLFPAVCAACGRETRLPFKPRGDRPPYCPDCFDRRRG